MPKEIVDITPKDSIVPIYLEELTEEELTQRETDAVAHQLEEDAKVAARESAIAKLSALGLTEDEIKALVGA
jgi:uncharacterized protein YfaA (DUF2138 family)